MVKSIIQDLVLTRKVFWWLSISLLRYNLGEFLTDGILGKW